MKMFRNVLSRECCNSFQSIINVCIGRLIEVFVCDKGIVKSKIE